MNLVEVETLNLGLVVDGPVHIDGRDGHLDHHLRHLLVEIEDSLAVGAFYLLDIHGLVVLVIDHFRRCHRGLEGESAVLVIIPSFGATESHQVIGLLGHIALQRLVAVFQIDDDAAFSVLEVLGEGVAVHAHIVGGGHFGEKTVVEGHRIVAGSSLLIVVGEREGVLLVDDGGFPDERGDEDVAVVLAAGAAQVGVRETVDAVVAVMVGGTAVPALQTGIGAELDGAERKDGAGIGVAVPVGAHQRVDVL